MDYVAVNGGGTHPGALRHPSQEGKGGGEAEEIGA
jgi:hypothetical protein